MIWITEQTIIWLEILRIIVDGTCTDVDTPINIFGSEEVVEVDMEEFRKLEEEVWQLNAVKTRLSVLNNVYKEGRMRKSEKY